MRTRLFQIFRQRDGRSLARAMAFLLALQALALGLDAGTMAAAATAGTICSSSGSATLPASGPAGHRDTTCCLTGCAAPALALPPAMALPAPPAFVALADPVPPGVAVAARRPDAASPRGPPRAA